MEQEITARAIYDLGNNCARVGHPLGHEATIRRSEGGRPIRRCAFLCSYVVLHLWPTTIYETGWTIEHGYLLQMGGFTLYDGKNFLGVLSIDMLEKYVHRITLDHPTLTKEAIEDKSKSDGLAKGLVTVQVTWFVIQAFARYTQDLVVTQLEIATIALGVLNGAMYMGWRKKPLNVQVPIPIYLEPAGEDTYRQGQLGARWEIKN